MHASSMNRRRLLQAGAALGVGAGLPASADAEERPVGAPKLKITKVTSYVLKHRLSRPVGASVSVPLSRFRTALLVKIETDEGLVGWGESEPISGARGTIDDHLAPLLIGQNPLEYRRLWREMWGPNFGNALAVGALDMALNDVRGRALNLSVAELFGGRLRDRVPAYGSGMNYLEGMRPEDYFADHAAQMVEEGYRALKMRIGRYPIRREAKVIEDVRNTVGPDIRLMADGNAAYTMGAALRMGQVLNDLDFLAFEEPMPQSPKYAGYEELRKKLSLPLAGGEAVDSRGSAKQLIDRRCMDIIQPDISLCGGIGEVLFISELAALSGIRTIPHCWGGAIVIAATVQLLSIMPDPHWGYPTDTPMLEVDQSENPWRTELITRPFQVKDGFVDVPNGPGLGIEVNEDVVAHYAI